MALSGQEKKVYQREYMRRRRAAKKGNVLTVSPVRPVRPAKRERPERPASSDLASRIISDLKALKITEGRYRGEYFEVLPWQKNFVEGLALNTTAALTVARGNGKTTLVSGIAISALKGALSRPRGEIVLVASSLKQARIAFRHVLFFMPEVRKQRKKWRVIDNSHQAEIENRKTGVVLKAIGSDPDKAHGLAPSLVLADEPAKWLGGGREMYAALETAGGKQVDDKLIAIGTRPKSEDHWFSELLLGGESVYTQIHAADKNDPDFAESTIRQANPSYDHFPDLVKKLWIEAEKAKKGGNNLAMYRALRLNLGTPEIAEQEMLIAAEDWKAITSDNPPPRQGPVAVGVDLGGGSSMTAVAFYWPETGRLEVGGCFPARPDLEERGKLDYVGRRYLKMFEVGELRVYPGRATNNKRFLTEMSELIEGQELLGVAADRYKALDLEQAIENASLGWKVDWRVVGRGAHGSEDVRAFQAEVLEGHMGVAPSLLMESAISESILHRDTNRNPALNKKRSKGRNDALQAALLAVGMGRRWRLPTPKKGTLADYFLQELQGQEAFA